MKSTLIFLLGYQNYHCLMKTTVRLGAGRMGPLSSTPSTMDVSPRLYLELATHLLPSYRPDAGTYVWDYSQDTCPDTLVSLYRGWIKVLTNSTVTFTDGTAIMSWRDKNQVAGLELKETMILCGRAAQTTHIENIAVFFHPWSRSRWPRASSTW
jgi:hypothetical protein